MPRSVQSSRCFLLIVLVTACTSSLVLAQTQTGSRITEAVDEARLTLLHGNVHPWARAEFDRGAAPSTLPMQRMLLVLKRSPEQEASLKSLLDEQQEKIRPTSTNGSVQKSLARGLGPPTPTCRRSPRVCNRADSRSQLPRKAEQ